MDYYDLRVQTADEKTLEIAGKLGFSGVCLTHEFENIKKYRSFLEDIKNLKTDLEIIKGVYIKAENVKKMKRVVSKVRNMTDIILMAGGSLAINKAAVEDPRVDVLTHPEFRRNDSGIDQVLARASGENYVAIEIGFSDVLNTFGKIRAHILKHKRRNIKLAEKYGSPIVITSGAKDPYGMRPPRDLASLGYNLGLDILESLKAVGRTPEYIFKRNREKVRSPWRGMRTS